MTPPIDYPKQLHILSRQLNGMWVSKCLEFNLFTHSLSHKMSMYTLLNLCAVYLETYDREQPASPLYKRSPPWDWVVFYAVTLLNQFNIKPRHIKTRTVQDYPRSPQ